MPSASDNEIHFAESRFSRGWHRLVYVVSAEWMLKRRPYTTNGGSVIVARSAWVTVFVYAVALLVRFVLNPYKEWSFSWPDLFDGIVNTLPWFGAIFAGVYAALYARFSSQWNYLATLFNQIMAAELQAASSGPVSDSGEAVLAAWKAGFIEDAEELHLATKPLFATVIQGWAAEPDVRTCFGENTVGGTRRLDQLMNSVEQVIKLHSNRWIQNSADISKLGSSTGNG